MLSRGLRILAVGIREEPRLFTIGVVGSLGFSALAISTAFVVGSVVGKVAIPAIDAGRIDTGALALAVAVLLSLSLLRVASLFARRLGAGYMQYRLQAHYRRRVTRRYLELPMAWHQRHATGTLLSNANSDVEAAWYPIAPLPFAVGTVAMLVVARGRVFVTDGAGARRPGHLPAADRPQRRLLAADGPSSPRPAVAGRAERDRARELRRRAGGQDHGAGGG